MKVHDHCAVLIRVAPTQEVSQKGLEELLLPAVGLARVVILGKEVVTARHEPSKPLQPSNRAGPEDVEEAPHLREASTAKLLSAALTAQQPSRKQTKAKRSKQLQGRPPQGGGGGRSLAYTWPKTSCSGPPPTIN
jgi:hypothetical protein